MEVGNILLHRTEADALKTHKTELLSVLTELYQKNVRSSERIQAEGGTDLRETPAGVGIHAEPLAGTGRLSELRKRADRQPLLRTDSQAVHKPEEKLRRVQWQQVQQGCPICCDII